VKTQTRQQVPQIENTLAMRLAALGPSSTKCVLVYLMVQSQSQLIAMEYTTDFAQNRSENFSPWKKSVGQRDKFYVSRMRSLLKRPSQLAPRWREKEWVKLPRPVSVSANPWRILAELRIQLYTLTVATAVARWFVYNFCAFNSCCMALILTIYWSRNPYVEGAEELKSVI
jgi:NRPS condensation-like uncharacterized protein